MWKCEATAPGTTQMWCSAEKYIGINAFLGLSHPKRCWPWFGLTLSWPWCWGVVIPHIMASFCCGTGPFVGIYYSSQFAPLVVFFLMFLAVVKNNKLSHFVRFNCMQVSRLAAVHIGFVTPELFVEFFYLFVRGLVVHGCLGGAACSSHFSLWWWSLTLLADLVTGFIMLPLKIPRIWRHAPQFRNNVTYNGVYSKSSKYITHNFAHEAVLHKIVFNRWIHVLYQGKHGFSHSILIPGAARVRLSQ